jgi:hypothetical protein
MIKRTDLLPLVFHVAQKQYTDRYGEHYSREKACEQFRNLADATMNACNMEVLNEEYLLDRALLTCFQEHEMFSYPELLDALNWREEYD